MTNKQINEIGAVIGGLDDISQKDDKTIEMLFNESKNDIIKNMISRLKELVIQEGKGN